MKKFEQLKKAFNSFKVDYAHHSDDRVYVSGITADFDRIFELTWKTLKEYISTELAIAEAKSGSPRTILKLAYKEGIITDEDSWLNMLADRNDDAHHYNEALARAYVSRIEREYVGVIDPLIQHLGTLIEPEPEILIDVPDEFIQLYKKSGLYYDQYQNKALQICGCEDTYELFKDWEKHKAKLLDSGDSP